MSDTDDIWRKLSQHDQRLSRLESPPQAGEPREAIPAMLPTGIAEIARVLKGGLEFSQIPDDAAVLRAGVDWMCRQPISGGPVRAEAPEDLRRPITAGDLRTLCDALTISQGMAANSMEELTVARAALRRIADTAPPAGKPYGPFDAANMVTIAQQALGLPMTPTPPEPSASDNEELLAEIMEYADPEGGKAHQLLLRAASALSMGAGTRELLTDIRDCREDNEWHAVELLEGFRRRANDALISQPEGQGVGNV